MMSGEHTVTSAADMRAAEAEEIETWERVAQRAEVAETERDRLRAELATCGKDWADERRAAQAEKAELLAALTIALAQLDTNGWATGRAATKARAAIAKATKGER